MKISVELTLTPLQDNYETPIIAFIKKCIREILSHCEAMPDEILPSLNNAIAVCIFANSAKDSEFICKPMSSSGGHSICIVFCIVFFF